MSPAHTLNIVLVSWTADNPSSMTNDLHVLEPGAPAQDFIIEPYKRDER